MRGSLPAGPFKRDLKRLEKRGWKVEKLQQTTFLLQTGELLPHIARPHKLSGEYDGLWECHIENDWLLIYDITDVEIVLHRTGTHADLFE